MAVRFLAARSSKKAQAAPSSMPSGRLKLLGRMSGEMSAKRSSSVFTPTVASISSSSAWEWGM